MDFEVLGKVFDLGMLGGKVSSFFWGEWERPARVRRPFCVYFYFREVRGVTMPTFGAIFSPVFLRGLGVFHGLRGLTGL
jgi:hypothetical protein